MESTVTPETVDWRVIEGVVCPGGWHYLQPLLNNPQPLKIEAITYQLLLNKVFKWRLEHLDLVPQGAVAMRRVERDIKAYICTSFPHQCNPIGRGTIIANPRMEAPPRVRPITPLIHRIETWLATVCNRPFNPVDPVKAQQRARICMQCPQNVRWDSNCGPCNGNIKRRSLLLRGDLYLPQDPHLRGCRVFGHLNEVAVWLPDTRSIASDEIPSICWLKQAEESPTDQQPV